MALAWKRVEVSCPRCEPGAGVVKQRGSQLHCFHCKQDVPTSGGKVVPLRKVVPNQAVEQAHRALLANSEWLAYLKDERGLKEATIEFGLQIGFTECHARRTAIDNTANGGTVALAEAGNHEQLADTVARHNGTPYPPSPAVPPFRS